MVNNRISANATASVVQSTQYYPFDASFADKIETSTQPYKYNGKELDSLNGLNMYDYSARYKDDWRFTTVDPLAEKYYGWSPYVYCGNNPLKYIDPTGMDWYLNEQIGETYFNQDISDKITTYKEQIYTRIGGNTMFGNQGEIIILSYLKL